MKRWYIEGGRRLCGTVRVHGAKNGVLPILAACLLLPEEVKLCRVPLLSDVAVSCEILRRLGGTVHRVGDCVAVSVPQVVDYTVPDEMMRRQRASVIFLGALLARCGRAEVSYPGGCALGPRPIDWHLAALRRMGACIEECGGRLTACAERLRGCELSLEQPSVGATENVILAAVYAEGETVLHNAAKEPEVADLCRFLVACGAAIDGCGTSTLRIRGVSALHGCTYTVMPDRIEAATYLLAGACTGGEVCVAGIAPSLLGPLPELLQEAGCRVHITHDGVALQAPEQLCAVRPVSTNPYPAFPTDVQAPFMAAVTRAAGTTVIVENLFSGRFGHVDELRRMGADIRVYGRTAAVSGVERLCGAAVKSPDLRGGAALVLGGLQAAGCTEICNTCYIERGYENMPGQLQRLGAAVSVR